MPPPRACGPWRSPGCAARAGRRTPTSASSARHWRLAGTAVHLANGAAAGIAFRRLGLRGWRSGVVAAQLEGAALWPGMAVVDRFHPDRRSGDWPPLLRNPRVFAQEVAAHAIFGGVLGLLLRTSPS